MYAIMHMWASSYSDANCKADIGALNFNKYGEARYCVMVGYGG